MAVIYLLEDDINIREIESIALKNSGYEVREFGTAADFWSAAEKDAPALILLDIMLPDADGLAIVERIRSMPALCRIPVLMVTAKTAEIDRVKGLDGGADDYLTKPFGIMELISRVKALLRRTAADRVEKEISIGAVHLDEEKRQVTVEGKLCELTYKEYELLKLLMMRAGIVTSREEILSRVWGTDFEGESRTLDMHIKTLRKKLKEAGSMIRTVRNVGYIFTP